MKTRHYRTRILKNLKLTRYVKDKGIDFYGVLSLFPQQQNNSLLSSIFKANAFIIGQIKHVSTKDTKLSISSVHSFCSVLNHFGKYPHKYKTIVSNIEYPTFIVVGLFVTNATLTLEQTTLLKDNKIICLSDIQFIRLVLEVLNENEIEYIIENESYPPKKQ